LAGWFLDSPSHWSTQTLLLPTSSVTFWSTVARANCGAQSRQIPLWDGLNLSSSLVLDVVVGQLSPLSLSAFALLLSSLVSISQCLVFLSGFILTDLTCVFSMFIVFRWSNSCLFGSSSAFIDSPYVATLGVPCLEST